MYFDAHSHVLDPMEAPGHNFDLADWKLTLPVNKSGGTSGTAVEVKNLEDYQHPKFFHTGDDGAMVFQAPVKGATTSGSHYTRSELREMDGTAPAAWTSAEGGTMVAELAVNQAPRNSDGTSGRLVVGQVHGEDEELCRLYYEKNTLYVVDDHGGPGGHEAKFALLDATGHSPKISLGEHFGYKIDVHNGNLTVNVQADGKLYKMTEHLAPAWNDDHFYFKAGVYNGVGAPGSGAGRIGSGGAKASFYDLMVSHS